MVENSGLLGVKLDVKEVKSCRENEKGWWTRKIFKAHRLLTFDPQLVPHSSYVLPDLKVDIRCRLKTFHPVIKVRIEPHLKKHNDSIGLCVLWVGVTVEGNLMTTA